jgi:hypothetical protein
MRSAVRLALLVVAFGSIVGPTGCSHDTITSGANGLSMTYTPSPAGSGRYERASFIINRLQALPADPALAAVFGPERIQFRFNPFTADLTQTEQVAFAQIALSSGTYVVTELEVTPLALVDTNIPQNPQTCIEGLSAIDGSQPAGIPKTFAIANPPNLTFTVHPGQTTLALTVNVPDLIAGYEAAYTCQLGCGPGGTPCLTAFNQAAFIAALTDPNILSIR